MFSAIKDFLSTKAPIVRSEKQNEVSISEIEYPIKPLYHDDKTIARLANSIKSIGLIMPVHLYKDETREKYILLSGQKRLFAYKFLNVEKIPAKVTNDIRKADSILICEYFTSANSDIFKAASILKYLINNRNYSLENISEMSGESSIKIEKYMALDSLRHEERRILAKSGLSLDVCARISSLEDGDLRREIISTVCADVNIERLISEHNIQKKYYKFDCKLIDNSISNLMLVFERAGINANLDRNINKERLSYTISVSP